MLSDGAGRAGSRRLLWMTDGGRRTEGRPGRCGGGMSIWTKGLMGGGLREEPRLGGPAWALGEGKSPLR